MSVSSISSLNPASYQSTTPSVTSNSSASASSPVVPSNDPGLAQQVSALSTTASVVATLGSYSTNDALTYDAAGLYNSIAQAGQSATTTPAASTPAASTTAASATTTPATTSTTSTAATGTGSGYYNGSGVLQSDPASSSNLTANWSSALQQNPTLSNTVAADSFAQGIIGTISTTA
jgi:hypothetical protein